MNDLEQKIEEIKAKAIKDIEEAIKEAKKDNVKSKRWRGNKGNIYYSVMSYGKTIENIEDLDSFEEFRYKTRNYFKTREEAEEHLEKINTYYELMDIAEELNRDKEIDWSDDYQEKFKIVCINKNKIEQDSNYAKESIGEIYCLDENFLDIAKERIGEEKLKKLFL